MWPIDVLLELRLVFVTVAIAVSSVCSTQQLWAQPESSLYVVSGYPSGDPDIHVPTHVYTLSRETQTLTDVVGLVPATAQTAFVRVYQDLRLLIVATPHYRPEQVSIVSMDKPCEFRTVTLNYSGSFQPLGCYLLDTPHDGLWLWKAFPCRHGVDSISSLVCSMARKRNWVPNPSDLLGSPVVQDLVSRILIRWSTSWSTQVVHWSFPGGMRPTSGSSTWIGRDYPISHVP